MAAKKKNNLEQSFEQLEEILGKLEEEGLGLEDSFQYYEQGMALVKQCTEQLDAVEKKLMVIRNEEAHECE